MKKKYVITPAWGIEQREDGRFIIVEASTGVLLHDSQYGYKSYENARKYGYSIYRTEPVSKTEDFSEKPNLIEDPLY